MQSLPRFFPVPGFFILAVDGLQTLRDACAPVPATAVSAAAGSCTVESVAWFAIRQAYPISLSRWQMSET